MLKYYLFTFESSNRAMKAELAVNDMDGVRLIPLLPEISAGCGLMMKCEVEKFDEVKNIFIKNNIEIAGIYSVGEDSEVLRII